jgi:hypothetical protein
MVSLEIQVLRVSTCYPSAMHTELPQEPQSDSDPVSSPSPPKRIQTQIHRRQKAKAVPPMQDEWDVESPSPPDLRTPDSKMKKSFPEHSP